MKLYIAIFLITIIICCIVVSILKIKEVKSTKKSNDKKIKGIEMRALEICQEKQCSYESAVRQAVKEYRSDPMGFILSYNVINKNKRK